MAGKAMRLICARPAFLVAVAAFLPASWLGLAVLLHSPQSAPFSFGRLYPGNSSLSLVPGAGRTGPLARFIVPAVTGTPTPRGIVSGHVTWQGSTQPDPRQVQTATLGLCHFPPGVVYFNVTTDQSGNFSVVTDLPDGNYSWLFKGPRSLLSFGSLVISGGGTGVVDMNNPTCDCQKAGDADDNNVVSAPDFAIMRNTYGLAEGQPGYDRRADFDNSNVVNSSDFILLKANFGLSEPAIGCPLDP
jgi:hypothetical protein